MHARCLAAVFALILFGARAASSQLAGDAHVLAVIHRNLADPNVVTYNGPVVFVGDITRFGPIFQGVCKEAVNEDVDYEVWQWIYGGGQRTKILASYINCTHQQLPAPPFTPGANLIVYCERPHGTFECLNPIPASDANLQKVQQWTVNIHPMPRR
jgi:hypothetical protein